MKSIKYILCLILVGLLAVSCVFAETYTSTQAGFGGDVTITLEAEDGIIQSAAIEGADETPTVGGAAIETMNGALAALAGTAVSDLSVDAVAGATMTSTAVLNGIQDVVAQATGVEVSAEKAPVADSKAVYYAWGNNVLSPLGIEVELKDNAIASIEIVESQEADAHTGSNQKIQQTVIDHLIPRIIEHQSLAVDAISGATATSGAVKSAVAQAIDANGGDSSQWYTPVEKKDDVVTLEGYDVVVVGLGGSGMAAYISAAQNGATVFGIETTAKIGGQSATASGPMAINPQTKMDLENNGEKFLEEEDLIADWIDYCKGDAKEELVRWFVENSGETMDWLINDYGFEFEEIKDFFHPNHWKVWAVYAGDKTDMFTSAVEKAKAMNEKNDYCLELTAKELITDGDGKVVGVRAELYDGTTYEVYGNSVILATGGFISNAEMMNEYQGTVYNVDSIGTQKGAGIQMAQSVGGALYNIDMPVMMHIAQIKNIVRDDTMTPDQKAILTSLVLAPDNLMVGEKGTRFCNEAGNVAFDNYLAGGTYYAIYTRAMIDSFKTDGLIYPTSTRWLNQGGTVPEAGVPIEDMDEILTLGEAHGDVIFADTVEDLAAKIGVDASVLQGEIDAYSAVAKGEGEDAFGKDSGLVYDLSEGPYVAVVGAGYTYGTCGGLDVNTDMNVLKADGAPIENLYAVGQDSMGVLFSNQVPYVTYGGAAQGWTITSGRQAGAKAAGK